MIDQKWLVGLSFLLFPFLSFSALLKNQTLATVGDVVLTERIVRMSFVLENPRDYLAKRKWNLSRKDLKSHAKNLVDQEVLWQENVLFSFEEVPKKKIEEAYRRLKKIFPRSVKEYLTFFHSNDEEVLEILQKSYLRKNQIKKHRVRAQKRWLRDLRSRYRIKYFDII